MKKYLIGFLLALAIAVPTMLVVLGSRCKEPTNFEIVMIQLGCARDMDTAAVTAEACQKLHGTPECEFVEADGEALTDIFFQHINSCARKTLKEKNFCEASYKDM